MNLSQIKAPAGQTRKRKRVGRGMGSGTGKTSGRGQKGQKSISGYKHKRGFEGGQMPMHRRLPKRGFKNIFRQEYVVLNVGRLEKMEGDAFDPETLLANGTLKKLQAGLKILAGGELTRAIRVKAHAISPAAEKKILAAGGTVERIGAPQGGDGN